MEKNRNFNPSRSTWGAQRIGGAALPALKRRYLAWSRMMLASLADTSGSPLAILPARNRKEGIFHFGMAVEDVKGAVSTAKANGATGGTDKLPRDGRFAETFVLDPVGTRVDLSPGWKV